MEVHRDLSRSKNCNLAFAKENLIIIRRGDPVWMLLAVDIVFDVATFEIEDVNLGVYEEQYSALTLFRQFVMICDTLDFDYNMQVFFLLYAVCVIAGCTVGKPSCKAICHRWKN